MDGARKPFGRARRAGRTLALALLVAGCGEAATAERAGENAAETGARVAGAARAAVGTEDPAPATGDAEGRAPAPGAAEGVAMELEAVASATERFREVDVALAEGYVRDPTDGCFTAEHEGLPRQLGGMGIHYFRPELLGMTTTSPRVDGSGTHTDFLKPGVLVYEPRPDGSPELVAVENLVFARAWRAAGHEEPPTFLGNEYHYRHDNPETGVDEAHGFEPHYELHVWLYRPNPAGTFAQYNPKVSCEHHATRAGGHGHAVGSD